MSSPVLASLLDQLLRGESLEAAQAKGLMEAWLTEQLEPVDRSPAAALRPRGSTKNPPWRRCCGPPLRFLRTP